MQQRGEWTGEREKIKDAIAVIQARNEEGLCQSRNAGGECIQNISVSKKKGFGN